ncbi:MAG: helix-turn-helix domain-containing protein, partial [Candidatus Woesearchaeota archaeon]|nr:helix-turn-helix domain-containing protein [Candidatus Woesearchaeota archaeon]
MDKTTFQIDLKESGLTINDLVEMFQSVGYKESGVISVSERELIKQGEEVQVKNRSGLVDLISGSDNNHELVYSLFRKNFIKPLPMHFADGSGSQTEIGHFTFYSDGRISYKGIFSEIRLGKNEYPLIRLLAENSQKIISAKEIAEVILYDGIGSKMRERAASAIYGLKDKMLTVSGEGDIIMTFSKKGYSINPYVPVRI